MAIRKSRALSAALGGSDDISVGAITQLKLYPPLSLLFSCPLSRFSLARTPRRRRRDRAPRASVQPSPRGPANAPGRLAGAAFDVGRWWQGRRAAAVARPADAAALRMRPRVYDARRVWRSREVVRRLLCHGRGRGWAPWRRRV